MKVLQKIKSFFLEADYGIIVAYMIFAVVIGMFGMLLIYLFDK